MECLPVGDPVLKSRHEEALTQALHNMGVRTAVISRKERTSQADREPSRILAMNSFRTPLALPIHTISCLYEIVVGSPS